MSPGEIHLARFPMGGRGGMKVRPVLLLTGPVGPVPEVLAAYISSALPPAQLPSDILLDPGHPDHLAERAEPDRERGGQLQHDL